MNIWKRTMISIKAGCGKAMNLSLITRQNNKRKFMKIAITSTGDSIDSLIDQRFGRALEIFIYDTETKGKTVIHNTQSLNMNQGAGIQTAENISRHDVKYVITGHCGPKAFRTLQSAGIKVIVGAQGTVKDAIKRFNADELVPVEKPDVEGHWV